LIVDAADFSIKKSKGFVAARLLAGRSCFKKSRLTAAKGISHAG